MTELSLQEIIQGKLSEEDLELPVIDQIALELQRIINSRKCELSSLARVIQTDQSLAMKVLNLANSPFFCQSQKCIEH